MTPAGRVARWELGKRIGLYHVNKSYQHKAETFLENGKNKMLWDFETQKSHNIQARWLDQIVINKKETTWQTAYAKTKDNEK